MRWSKLGVRWTIGDVSERGFEALRLSLWGAWWLWERTACYAVCVNSIPLERAQALTGPVPDEVEWMDASAQMPVFLRERFDAGMAEGVGWKLAPLRLFPDRHELSLDNDCILWDVPVGMAQWLAEKEAPACLVAEDVRACFGRFASLCPPEPRNLGIRGLPPDFDLEMALREVLEEAPGILSSELDEQGMQLAALSRPRPAHVVKVEEVSICSPFPPHLPALGRCGAHFCGLNASHLPWRYGDQPAEECVREHWERHRRTLYSLVGLPAPREPLRRESPEVHV